MDYTLAKELKEAGFPQKEEVSRQAFRDGETVTYIPSLEELIEACEIFVQDKRFRHLEFNGRNAQAPWVAKAGDYSDAFGYEFNGCGKTPTEAVARLWLALNKKDATE